MLRAWPPSEAHTAKSREGAIEAYKRKRIASFKREIEEIENGANNPDPPQPSAVTSLSDSTEALSPLLFVTRFVRNTPAADKCPTASREAKGG